MKLSRLTLALAGIGFCTMTTIAFAQEVKAQEESKKMTTRRYSVLKLPVLTSNV